ncbi:Ff.00g006900.m01.CDS01 [Fusarium sp. VM40]|nr:Ff.00g006900.m01.CDS01 [Fusarium sp. VM40]
MSDSTNPNTYTVGWVCALTTEFTAAQEQFDEQFEEDESPRYREPNDYNLYAFGRIHRHMVVIAALPHGQYGTTSAAIVAKDLIRSFPNIRIGLMVGIGGGAPSEKHDIRLGDVVVSSPTSNHGGVFQYDFGKASEEAFQHTGHLNSPPQLLLAALTGLKSQYDRKGLKLQDEVDTIVEKNTRLRAKYRRPVNPDLLFAVCTAHENDPCFKFCTTAPTDIVTRTPREEPMEDVEVHYGTIASGNTLMKDAASRDKLARQEDILCFEMEAAGLMNGFPCLVVRGICDYSDAHKNDIWQGYAAMTAAVYAKQILKKVLPEAVENEATIISKVEEVISNVKTLIRSLEEREALDWLSDTNFGAYQLDERDKKAPGTCEWFLTSREYRFWIQEEGQVLFCPGIAGAGKTVLVSAIIEDLHSRFQNDPSTAIAHIYCRYDRTNRQTFDELRASLLRQLCEKLSPLPQVIMELHNEYKLRRMKAPPERIISCLESVSGFFSMIFVVIDALDEWQQVDCHSLPKRLLFLQGNLPFNLLATSRPLPLIESHFSGHQRCDIKAQQQDIYAYVDNFEWPESHCIGKIPGLKDSVKAIMCEITRGMFLLTKLYLQSLENETSERDVKNALKRLKDRAKDNYEDPDFEVLDKAYNDTLKRLREQPKKQRDLAFRVLAWICCTIWKLPADGILNGLAWREGDTEFHQDGMVDTGSLLSVCWGLVEIPKGSREIRLVHYTTEDFFRHNRNLFDEYFWDQHSLDRHLPPSTDDYIYGPARSGNKYKNWQSELLDNPFYEYAAFNWGHHVRSLSCSGKTYDTIVDFLKNQEMVDLAVNVIFTFGGWDNRGEAPRHVGGLHLAALFGLDELAISLVQSLEIDSRDSSGRTALAWLLECFAFEFELQANFRSGSILVPEGLYNGRLCVLEALLLSEANPSAPGYNEDTPLHLAAKSGDSEVVQRLLECKADVGTSNRYGDIPLVVAIRHGSESAYAKLLEVGTVDICGKNSRTALIECAFVGNPALLSTLIERGAKVNFQDEYGKTPLIEAAQSGHLRIVELLLANHSDINLQNRYGYTALMKACSYDRTDVVKLLLANNARLDVRRSTGKSVFTDAGRHSGDDIMKQLLREDIDTSVRNSYFVEALMSASEEKRPHAVSLILGNATFKPELRNLDAILSISFSDGNERVIKLLIDHGADPNTEVVLIDAGADIEGCKNDDWGPIHAALSGGTQAMLMVHLLKQND